MHGHDIKMTIVARMSVRNSDIYVCLYILYISSGACSSLLCYIYPFVRDDSLVFALSDNAHAKRGSVYGAL